LPQNPHNYVLLDDQATGQQLYFTQPESMITAYNIAEVTSAFDAIEAALADGKYIAGYFAYELGFALEPSLQHLLDGPHTLLKLGVFEAPNEAPPPHILYSRQDVDISLTPDWNEAEYIARFDRLKDYIVRGDCYQSNLTFPMRGKTDASAKDIFAAFRQNQPGRYGALLKLGGPEIISFSPELFFERTAQNMRMRPMKGTRLETYPTLHQMTSQITAELNDDVSWLEIFKGLYPCGSVTGAPKIRAMEIIHELESGPRGPYCGAIGYITPDNFACFNVAIRTAVLDQGKLRYDVGSGVVYDSGGADEYRECLLKSDVLRQAAEHVFETFRLDASGKFIRLEAHLARLKSACAQKGWEYPETDINRTLETTAQLNKNQTLRIRLQVGRNDKSTSYAQVTTAPYQDSSTPLSIAISRYALSPHLQDVSLKTSKRQFYEGERARLKAKNKNIDEVIFLNPLGDLCEGSFTSIYLDIDGQLFTPPLTANILPSILRAELIKSGRVQSRRLTKDDLSQADKIWCGNSLRGLNSAKLITHHML